MATHFKILRSLGVNFWLFATGRLLVYIGSIFSTVIIPTLAFTGTGQIFFSSISTTMATVPYLIFGLIAGSVVDNSGAKKVLISSIVILNLTVLSIPVVSLFASVGIVQLLFVAFVSGTCFTWFDSACFGILPSIVPEGDLVKANSVLWTSGSLIEITIPALVAFFIGRFVPEEVLIGEPLLLCFALLFLVKLPRGTISGLQGGSFRGRVSIGLKFIRSTRYVRELTFVGTLSAIQNGVVLGLLAVINTVLDYSAIGPWTATALGALLASIFIPFLSNFLFFGYITIISLAGCPLVATGLLWAIKSEQSTWTLFLLSMWSFCTTLIVLNGITVRQKLTPINLQARVNTTGRMLAWGGTPFGAFIGGVISDAWSIDSAFLFLTIFGATVAAVAATSGLRRKMEGMV